jgi:outer membrane protein assembly factor BamA
MLLKLLKNKVRNSGSHAKCGLALLATCLFWTNSALAMDPFVIADIRVEGLQRISEGTVYNYLPLDAGDRRHPRALSNGLFP